MSRREYRRNLQLCLTPTDKAKLLEIAEQFGCYPSNGRGKGPSISTLATRIAKGEILVRRAGEPTHRFGRDASLEALDRYRNRTPKGMVFPRDENGRAIRKGIYFPAYGQNNAAENP